MKTLEQKLRRQLRKIGYRLEKSRVRNTHINNQCGYMIIKIYNNIVYCGCNYELTLKDVERITADLHKNVTSN
jgi:hypothetical protein